MLIFLVTAYIASYNLFINFFACDLHCVCPWLLGCMHEVYPQLVASMCASKSYYGDNKYQVIT